MKLTQRLFVMVVGLLLGVVMLACEAPVQAEAEDARIAESLLTQCPLADGFDYPVGKPNAKGYYNAQKFGRNQHLGDDWNGVGGGNTDLGDPVYVVAHGIVVFAEEVPGGWGNVVRVVHNIGSAERPVFVESLYAHLQRITVTTGTVLKRGQRLGTIGTANGAYLAHLHLELRTTINQSIGSGYSSITTGYADPTAFIKSHRPPADRS